ncbi:helix-turn-helix domain-containing protein [Pseudoduganella aquatica]|uniref:helix-turn-helix domain-containing protein n=1 Tax=Pseudoduganella aquatica TaxID=2660641 RepID=UPI001E5103F4|nr:helix-turn-helix transcriptional regulator [Pseudoduganella aquatica]
MARDYDQLRKQLAYNIRVRRGQKGLSQEALAFSSELDRTYISQVERCVGNPSLLVLTKVATALGVDIQELFEVPPDNNS